MKFHVGISLDYLIHHRGAAEMAGHVRLAGAETWATEPELLAHATILKAQGFELLPGCSKHDARGRCQGHEEESHG